MLHELLLALIGFTGDIIVESQNCFAVRNGFDLLTIAEKEQIDKIVILGWYYNKLAAFVKKHNLQWGRESNHFQAYKHATSLGIADLLSEYVDDIALLEQVVSNEGPIPLSHITHHVQKVIQCSSFYLHLFIKTGRRSIFC